MNSKMRFCLITLQLMLLLTVNGMAQPVVFYEPDEFNYLLPYGTETDGVIQLLNDGDQPLNFSARQESAPPRDLPIEILAWLKYTDLEQEWANTKTSLGQIPAPYHLTEYEGGDSLEFADLLHHTDVLLMPDMGRGLEGDIRPYAMLFAPAILEFLDRGGIAIFFDVQGQAAMFLRTADLMKISITQKSINPIDCKVRIGHPVTDGVGLYTVLRANNLHVCEDADALALAGPEGNQWANITVRQMGKGSIVYFGADWQDFNPEMTKMLNNTVYWSRGGTNWLQFDPLEGVVEPGSDRDIIFKLKSALTPGPGLFTRYIVIDTNDPDVARIVIPIRMGVTERLPVNLQVSPTELFVLGEPERDTSMVLTLTNPSQGSVYADISFDRPNVHWLKMNRYRIVLNPQEEDRVWLTFDPIPAADTLNVVNIQIVFDNPGLDTIRIPVRYYTGSVFGEISGEVTDSLTGNPVSAVQINLNGLTTATNFNGLYTLSGIPPATYQMRVEHRDFLPESFNDIQIVQDELTELSVALTFATCELEFGDTVRFALDPGITDSVAGQISNQGTGNLDYTSKFVDRNPPPWVGTFSTRLATNTGKLAEASVTYGAVLCGDTLAVSGISDLGQTKRIWLVDRKGKIIRFFDQPAGHRNGMAGLAWDGELLWGTGRLELFGLDLEGNIKRRFALPGLYYRAVTYDPRTKQLYLADGTHPDILVYTRGGQLVEKLVNPGLMITDMAFHEEDPDGFFLYVITKSEAAPARVVKLNPLTGESRQLFDVPTLQDEVAGGISLTHEWSPHYWTMVIQLNGLPGRTILYNLSPRTTWVRLEPKSWILKPGEMIPASVYMDTRGFKVGDILHGYFSIDGHQRGGASNLWVNVEVTDPLSVNGGGQVAIPTELQMSGYPNPFNDRMNIKFSGMPGEPVDLLIYDTAGRLVQTVAKGMPYTGGTVSMSWSARNFASGVYLVRLQQGATTRTQRVVLLR